MKRDRFLAIMRSWYFRGQEEFPGNRLRKIRLLVNHVNGGNNNIYTTGKIFSR